MSSKISHRIDQAETSFGYGDSELRSSHSELNSLLPRSSQPTHLPISRHELKLYKCMLTRTHEKGRTGPLGLTPLREPRDARRRTSRRSLFVPQSSLLHPSARPRCPSSRLLEPERSSRPLLHTRLPEPESSDLGAVLRLSRPSPPPSISLSLKSVQFSALFDYHYLNPHLVTAIFVTFFPPTLASHALDILHSRPTSRNLSRSALREPIARASFGIPAAFEG